MTRTAATHLRLQHRTRPLGCLPCHQRDDARNRLGQRTQQREAPDATTMAAERQASMMTSSLGRRRGSWPAGRIRTATGRTTAPQTMRVAVTQRPTRARLSRRPQRSVGGSPRKLSAADGQRRIIRPASRTKAKWTVPATPLAAEEGRKPVAGVGGSAARVPAGRRQRALLPTTSMTKRQQRRQRLAAQRSGG